MCPKKATTKEMHFCTLFAFFDQFFKQKQKKKLISFQSPFYKVFLFIVKSGLMTSVDIVLQLITIMPLQELIIT